MKRTALKRKTPLAQGAPPKRSPVKRAPKRRPAHAANDEQWRSDPYLVWVRSLPCCNCGARGGDAHHVIGLRWGLSGMGMTAPDSFAMPACRACHQEIHRSPEMQRWQPTWLRHVISLGVRQFDGEIREALRAAWRFIDEKEAA